MRGGGKHRDKKSKTEKQVASQERLEPLQRQLEQKDAQESDADNVPAIRKSEKDAVIRMIEEDEGCRKSTCQK